MPKIKTNRGAAKRFKQTGTGKYKYRKANRNHILTKKTQKRKRHLRALSVLSMRDMLSVRRMLRQMKVTK